MLRLLLPVREMACSWAATVTLGIESSENPIEDRDVNAMPSAPWLRIQASASETVVLGVGLVRLCHVRIWRLLNSNLRP